MSFSAIDFNAILKVFKSDDFLWFSEQRPLIVGLKGWCTDWQSKLLVPMSTGLKIPSEK